MNLKANSKSQLSNKLWLNKHLPDKEYLENLIRLIQEK